MRGIAAPGTALALGALLFAACGKGKSSPMDAAGTIDTAADTTADTAAGVDAAPARTPCLDQPADLPRPPSGRLPCELLPPGFSPPPQ
jgi:hypothetical protein